MDWKTWKIAEDARQANSAQFFISLMAFLDRNCHFSFKNAHIPDF